jgi:hypothetical protein
VSVKKGSERERGREKKNERKEEKEVKGKGVRVYR